MNDHTEYAEGLRQVAAFLESHPEIDLPETTITGYSLFNKEKAATTARALAQGGRCDKVFEDTLVTLKRDFGPIELRYFGNRSNVCEQVKVGTKVVPEQYVAPRPATEAQVIPEHEEGVYEWRCAPLLGKPDIEGEVGQPELVAASSLQLEAGDDDIPF